MLALKAGLYDHWEELYLFLVVVAMFNCREKLGHVAMLTCGNLPKRSTPIANIIFLVYYFSTNIELSKYMQELISKNYLMEHWFIFVVNLPHTHDKLTKPVGVS
jgi:hypothetical protein